MVSHPELSSDPPIGSDRESGFDNITYGAKNGKALEIFQFLGQFLL